MATNITNTAFTLNRQLPPHAMQHSDSTATNASNWRCMSWPVVAQSMSGLSVISSAASFSKSQADKGEQALSHAFSPPPPTEQKVLFYLPVTKA
jgi:hypothetical protein